jgi:hypothetical protein
MNRTNFGVAALVFASMSTVGCGGASGDDATRLPFASTSTQDESGAKPSPKAPYQHLYFDMTNHLDVDSDVLAAVDLVAGAKVQVEAVTTDASTIRFEVWRGHADGQMELVNAFHVESGFVLTTIEAPSDGRMFLHFPAPADAQSVVVHLGCARENGRCTTDLQPGEGCFAGRACAEGLACIPADGTCDPVWRGGTCTAPVKDVACDGEPVGAVCGCDGLTYASACLARASGRGVASFGACPEKPAPSIAERL